MNYYDVLRIDKNASAQEIKDSYKKLIKRYHPDLYPGNKVRAEAVTRDLNEAYEVLSDPEKRAMYDLSLQEPIQIYTEPYIPPKDIYIQEEIIEEPKSYTWDQKLKKNIYEFVDKKTQSMSKKAKDVVILIVILSSLIILLFTIKDYLDFQLLIKQKESSQNLEKTQNSVCSTCQN